uniref:Uncharacterized protein n=1 Tax=Oryza rufipogon TaxID=4529 RepID=A0A0E0N6Y5_ORYRU
MGLRRLGPYFSPTKPKRPHRKGMTAQPGPFCNRRRTDFYSLVGHRPGSSLRGPIRWLSRPKQQQQPARRIRRAAGDDAFAAAGEAVCARDVAGATDRRGSHRRGSRRRAPKDLSELFCHSLVNGPFVAYWAHLSVTVLRRIMRSALHNS